MNYELNKDLVHNDMVVEGADGEIVGACGDAEGEGTAGLSAQHVEFPLFGAEGFLQTEDGGLGIIYGYTEAQVASIEGSSQKDDALRKNSFNTAVGALKKLRSYRVGNKPASQLTAEDRRVLDDLDLRGGEVLMRKMQAETGMNLQDAAKESRGLAIVTFQGYLMTHEPQDADAFKNMSPDQRNNLERCYANLLPLMAAHGSDKADILEYGNKYRKFFPNGKHKQDVETVLKPLEGN